MDTLEKYYCKFNENKRLLSRHGQVEFFVTMHYIHEIIGNRKNLNIIDIGAGTGRYSAALAEEGHNVTAIDLVKKNVGSIKLNSDKVIAKQGNALNLKFDDETFDITLLFGPVYHLFSHKERLKAIEEAKRVTKKDGHIFIMYLSNEYAVITYLFKEGNLEKCIENKKIDKSFQCLSSSEDLFDYVRLEEINLLKNEAGLQRVKIIGVDGATDYIRQTINKLSENDFELYKQYQLSICERPELLGASSHIMDILKK